MITYCSSSIAVLRPVDTYSADVVFILDSSQNVGQANFLKQKEFLQSLILHLNVHSGKSRVAVVNYGNIASIVTDFDLAQNLSEFKRRLDASPYIGGKNSEKLS